MNIIKFTIRRITEICWKILGYGIPKKRKAVLFSSFPDFDDTFLALLDACEKLDWELTVLTREHSPIPINLMGRKLIIAKAWSLRGIWHYHRARIVIFTHGLFSGFKPHSRQLVFNVWHGTPIKRIALLDGKLPKDVPKSDYALAESDKFRPIVASAFGLEENRVIVGPHPRIDILNRSTDASAKLGLQTKKIVSWLPTYRSSKIGDIRTDGDLALDILGPKFDLRRIDTILCRANATCLIKPHPMAKFDQSDFGFYTNIRIISDSQLQKSSISLYELMAETDILITDLSSIYFDFKKTGRSTILFFPDRKAYEGGRGFVKPLNELIDEPINETIEHLCADLEFKLFSTDGRVNNTNCVEHSHKSIDLLMKISQLADYKIEGK